jgi:hypothetical protein
MRPATTPCSVRFLSRAHPDRRPPTCALLLLVALSVLGFAPAGAVVEASAVAVATAAPLPRCLEPVAPRFLVVREYVVLDAIPGAGLAIPPGRAASVLALLSAGGGMAPPALTKLGEQGELGEEARSALVVRLGQRALVVRIDRAVVRADAVACIDERLGAIQAVPATPAIRGGAHALAQPCAIGLGLSVGTARLFVGVRSAARSLAVRDDDVRALADLVRVPSAGDVLAALGAP